jgi:glycosyltransferase involved in cell wall biosynthesis
MPLFSIITPCYNRAAQISEAIQSVLRQRYTDWELLVIDDGSTDNSAEVIKNFDDPRVRYLYQENSERSAARNYGILNAKGMYICFLDSDDIYYDNHLSELSSAIEKNKYPQAFFHTQTVILESGGKESRKEILKPIAGESLPQRYMRKFIGTNCVCIHSAILEKYHFDEELNRAEDSDLFLRILTEYPVIEIEVYTTVYQLNPPLNDQAALLKQNRAYIRAWNKIYQNPDVRDQIVASVRNERLLKYYIWMWGSSLAIIPLRAMLKDLAALWKLSPFLVLRPVFLRGVLKKIFFTR